MDRSDLLLELPAGVCIIRNRVVEFVNAEFANARGVAPEALLHKAFHEIVHENDCKTVLHSINHSVGADRTIHISYNAPHPHVGSKRMYGSYRSIGSETLILVEHVESDRDESERKRDARVDYQQLAVSNSNDGIWVWNVSEQHVLFLGNFLASLGYEASDVQSEAAWALSLIHPDDVTATPTDFEPYRTGELKEWRTESRFRAKDGTWVWTLVRGRVIEWSDDGQPVIMIGSHVNIDDLKEAQQSLVRRNEVLSTISRANSHFVMGNDPMLAFREILDALLRTTDASHGMLAGVRYIDQQRHFVLHATNNPSPEMEAYQRGWNLLPIAFASALDQQKLEPTPIACKDSLQFFLGCNDNPIACSRILPVRSGTEVVGFVALSFDSHHVADPEDAILEPLMATYASLIVGYRSKIEESRTRDELARRSDELERTNAELEHANTMKDSFLANMSHELRSPLSTIIGVAEALTDGIYGQVSAAQRECLNDSREAAQHLLSLINDLLDLSRARLGEIELYVEEYHIEDLLRSTMSIMREHAYRKGISLEFSMPNERVVLLGDVRRIKQVFVNLLSNAIKFTPSGGSVTIGVEPNAEGNCVRVHVNDDGIGIAEEHLKHVFEPFIQLDSRLSRQHEGTGLGLPIVQRIVDLHGGVVEVQSKIGKGSTFTIVLPWDEAQRSIFEELKASEAISTREGAPVERGLMYIVDDNAMNRRLLRGYAEQEGFGVREFSGGQACLDAMIIDPTPDIIVMDIQMPGMDGLETIRRIRAGERVYEHTPIVALTALVMPGDRELCLAAGADHYVSKPVEYRDFVHEIVVMLSSMRSATPE